jgi:hypothetical protein
MSYIRVWNELEIESVKKHLLLIDDLYGTCANCKQLGLNYTKDKICKGCKTEFKFVATSITRADEIQKILNRIKSEAKDQARDLFKI